MQKLESLSCSTSGNGVVSSRIFRCLCLLGFLVMLSSLASAQCPYPCWSEVVRDQFTFYSYSPVSEPVPPTENPAIEFYYPMPTQAGGSNETISACSTYSNLSYDHYPFDRSTGRYDLPQLTGNVFHDVDLHHQESSSSSGWKGIFVRASFRGVISSNPDTNQYALTQSVFMGEDQCYEKGQEFGFYRQLVHPGNATEQGTVYFYYGNNTNCLGEALNSSGVLQGSCIAPKGSTPSDATTQKYAVDSVAVPVPNNNGVEATNHNGGYDWFWEAWLSNCGTWTIQVLDPYTFQPAPGTSVITHSVNTSVWSNAADIYANGLTGYASTVHQLVGGSGNIQAGTPAPEVKIYEVGAAKSVGALSCP